MQTIIGLALAAWLIASWFTHVIFCFKAGAWGFLVAGAILAPIAVVHGTWLWF